MTYRQTPNMYAEHLASQQLLRDFVWVICVAHLAAIEFSKLNSHLWVHDVAHDAQQCKD